MGTFRLRFDFLITTTKTRFSTLLRLTYINVLLFRLRDPPLSIYFSRFHGDCF